MGAPKIEWPLPSVKRGLLVPGGVRYRQDSRAIRSSLFGARRPPTDVANQICVLLTHVENTPGWSVGEASDSKRIVTALSPPFCQVDDCLAQTIQNFVRRSNSHEFIMYVG
jgi:hypothetical protein